jgi:MFS transporter, ACS family, D-galactonate transporter
MTAPNPATGTETSPAAMTAVSNRRRWTIVFLLFVASMINYFDRATLSFAMPQISESLGLKPTAQGVLLSAFFWSYALMQVPIGLVADRYNLKWIYAGAFALWSFAQGLTGFATSLSMLIGFRLVLGIGESIYLPGGTKTVSLLFPLSERGLPCGLFDFGTRTGLVLEGVLVPWMLQQYGWRITFAVIGFTALLWLIPWLMVTPRDMRAPARQESSTAAITTSTAPNPRRYIDLAGICLGFFCFDYFWFLLLTWLPNYLVSVRHLTLMKMGIYVTLPYLVFGVCQPIGGWFGDFLVARGGKETLVRKGIISLSFLTGLLLIPAAHATSANMAILFLMGACLVGLSTANQLVVLQGCAPPEKIGLWVGIYNFVGNLAGIVAPIVTGYIVETTHSYTPAFVLAAAMLVAGQLCYWLIVGEVRPQAAALAANNSRAN